ncbi:macrolide ABC transporter ATP-binding protein [Cupriavidus sp. USMAHM13]|uniref:ABC transporter ATP-binding protein n=1 Tax=Cupriavidus sp. USMAHM13 TaxID=1389192 RepID=UPI0008A6E6A1|nr:ABC transporter ATP-binding protein [Cupriavidus sp. USMAHM13]AOZ02119.1 macrolide ABC transporter ATP-binding protein [Cupriavidus sp. USMAHM13]
MAEQDAFAPIIQLRGIGKVFRRKQQQVSALTDIDLGIRHGDFAVIAGPSGSGKTTLLNIIGLLDTPTAGHLAFCERPLSQASLAELARIRRDEIGFVFQAYNLMPVLTAAENTEMVMEFQGRPAAERRRVSREVLEQLGLGGLMHRYPDQLSGGQQQRVAVARAIASRPKLVIADEPTANLDSKSARNLMDLMVGLNEQAGITFVFSSHDPQVIERGRRVISLRDGRIVADQQTVAFDALA